MHPGVAPQCLINCSFKMRIRSRQQLTRKGRCRIRPEDTGSWACLLTSLRIPQAQWPWPRRRSARRKASSWSRSGWSNSTSESQSRECGWRSVECGPNSRSKPVKKCIGHKSTDFTHTKKCFAFFHKHSYPLIILIFSLNLSQSVLHGGAKSYINSWLFFRFALYHVMNQSQFSMTLAVFSRNLIRKTPA